MALQRITGAMVSDSSITGDDVQDGSLGRADIGSSTIVLSAATATQSGTAKDFTGLPSWARRVVLLLYGVSVASASDILIQLGTSGAPRTSGYANCLSIFIWGSGILSAASTAGVPIYNNSGGYFWTGRIVMELLEPGIHNWIVTATLTTNQTTLASVVSTGVAPLTGPLDIVRLTTAAGNVAFDAGYASISWE